jgi:hypothetical protein
LDKRRLWLCAAPFAVCMLDQSLTLAGQNQAYWAGNYAHANELNPLFCWLLRQHPAAFEAGIGVWVLLFSSIICFAPQKFAMAGAIALIIGHTWGTATWLNGHFAQGYWLCILLFMSSGGLVVATWDKFSKLPDE